MESKLGPMECLSLSSLLLARGLLGVGDSLSVKPSAVALDLWPSGSGEVLKSRWTFSSPIESKELATLPMASKSSFSSGESCKREYRVLHSWIYSACIEIIHNVVNNQGRIN